MEQLAEVLRRYWGYDGFRPLQAEAMQCVLSGRDSLVVLPTGGGKSLCYQAPALCRDGLAIVVSPLISLMKDQVDTLRSNGIAAAYINSSQAGDERWRVANDVLSGYLKMLYIAPERLIQPRTLDFLAQVPLAMIAIDEAHCISEWGHDFRPEYRSLHLVRQRFPTVSRHAFTATATPRVREDILRQLQLRDPQLLVGSFDRPNLVYRVVRRSGR
ncbi:MAG: RecQ family ATP-dependent DNA helicase, partial [Planctomycetota bacterium]